MARIDGGETRAIAHLPHLEIEILHRPARDGHGEQLAILMSGTAAAMPVLLGMAQPLLFWMQCMEVAWAPWRMLTAPPRR